MRHIISLLLENEPGALSRVVGLFSQRNYNIESLTVAPTEDPTLSRLTLTTVGHDEVIEQITKNLNKLIEVVKLVDLSESAHIERELMLVKVKATGAPACRDQTHYRYLSRADRRCERQRLYRSTDRYQRQTGQLHPVDRDGLDSGNRTQWCHRDSPWRQSTQHLTQLANGLTAWIYRGTS